MSLQGAIKAFNAKVQDVAEDEFRARVIAIANDAIRNTPVDTGRLRGNWQITANAPATGELALGAGPALEAGYRLKLSDDAWISNNLPYAVPVEQGGPTNRPRRMLARAILRASKRI